MKKTLKIVRDKIPAIILRNNPDEEVKTFHVNNNEALIYLLSKIDEERRELIDAYLMNMSDKEKQKEEVLNELVDLFDIIRSIAYKTDISFDELQNASEIKCSERGWFNSNIVLQMSEK